MNSSNLPMLLIVMTFFIGNNLLAQTTDFQKATTKARKYVQKNANHSLVIGIVQNGKTRVLTYGKMSKENKVRPDGNTLFEIGSVTSVFTTSLMKLESQKQLFKMEDRIQDHFRDGVEVPNYQHYYCTKVTYNNPMTVDEMEREIISCRPDPMRGEACITFCHLASHSSGLKNNPKGLYSWNPIRIAKQKKDPYLGFTKEELYGNLKKMELSNEPGRFFRFSNWGIAVLGNLVADIANEPYEGLLKNRILKPLRLSDTRITLSEEQKGRLASGHDRKGKVIDPWHFKSMAPALGLKSSANDLLKFVQANIYTSNADLEDAFAHVQGAQVDLHERKLDRFTQMGYGWFTSTLNESTNLPVQWISGGTGGFRSFIGFSKDTKTGVVVLSNSANDVDEIGFLVLEGLNNHPAKVTKAVAKRGQ